MAKLTVNSKEILGVLATFEDGKAFAREVLNKMIADGRKDKTFNGVNATLAALVKPELVTKTKAMYGDKLLTQYTITEAGRAVLEETDAPAEADADTDAE